MTTWEACYNSIKVMGKKIHTTRLRVLWCRSSLAFLLSSLSPSISSNFPDDGGPKIKEETLAIYKISAKLKINQIWTKNTTPKIKRFIIQNIRCGRCLLDRRRRALRSPICPTINAYVLIWKSKDGFLEDTTNNQLLWYED